MYLYDVKHKISFIVTMEDFQNETNVTFSKMVTFHSPFLYSSESFMYLENRVHS